MIEDTDKAFNEMKEKFANSIKEPSILECGSENACQLKEELLSSKNSIITAEQAFELSYEHCDKEKILEHYNFNIILERIIRATNSGEFKIETDDRAWMMRYKPFVKILEENGYIVSVYRKLKTNELHASIDWGHSG